MLPSNQARQSAGKGRAFAGLFPILGALFFLCLAVAIVPARAHEFFTDKKDPATGFGCCGIEDCAVIPASWVEIEKDGFRIRLTLEQARTVNPRTIAPVDALVPWMRVQRSPDLDPRLCLYASSRTAPTFGVICFWWSGLT